VVAVAGKTLATFDGVAIRPGVSRNGRLYTREVIAKAVARAQERLADPEGMPLTMLTHHAAGDDSTLIVGRLTSLVLDSEGAARYTAALAETAEAEKILGLIEPDEAGDRFLKGVSIRGFWLGPVRRELHQGQQVETADDLELDGLDFTKTPGVLGASVDQVQRTESTEPAETTSARAAIHESAPDALLLVETSDEEFDMPTSAPVAASQKPQDGSAAIDRVQYADNGYRDGQKRFPLRTAEEATTAALAFHDPEVVGQYSVQQLKRAKSRIAKALEAHGLTVTDGVVATAPKPIGESGASITEYWDDGGFYVELNNGSISVRISSWCVASENLLKVGKAAMDGACAALLLIDPDLDGHVAAEAGEVDPEHEVSETDAPEAPAAPATEESTPAPDVAAVDPKEEEEPAVSEATNPASGTPASGVTLSDAQFKALLEAARGGAPAATPAAEAVEPPAPVEETEEQRIARIIEERLAAALPKQPEPVQETEEQRIERLVQEKLTSALQGHVEKAGPPARKGLIAGGATTAPVVGENFETNANGLPAGWPDKPLHTYTDTERQQYLLPQVEQAVMGGRSVYAEQ
jgi:hypothetical protein